MASDRSSGRILFTSESVTEGHPDKLCDQVADAIVDDVLANDPDARVAIEAAATTGLVFVLGEMTTSHYVDVQALVRRTVREIGYTDSRLGFDWETCGAISAIKEQSPDIRLGVDHALEARLGQEPDELGAGDQGMMFGYASDETPELMPMPIQLAHAVAQRLAAARKDGSLPFLRPDGKSQVTVEYDADGVPQRVHTVLVSAQHDPDVDPTELTDGIRAEVIEAAIPARLMDRDTRILVNPTGRWATPDSPVGRSSSTRTAAWRATAAGASAARIRPRSTARAPIWRASSPRISSPPGWPGAASSSWRTRSG
jgi:S-adenosylmethionine synthetase